MFSGFCLDFFIKVVFATRALGKHFFRSAELISTAYQPWNSIFLSQQNNHSRFISQKIASRTGPL
jgi:hypothetical protein